MGLQREIDDVMAIDQHAHPMAMGLEPPGDPERPIQPYDDIYLPLRFRVTNPEYLDAWAALWGYAHRDWSLRHLQELMEKKSSTMVKLGQAYDAWVLDQLKIEQMVAVSVVPSDKLPPPRFRWCAHLDWMLWPFLLQEPTDNAVAKLSVGGMAQMRESLGCKEPPRNLSDFLSDVMLPMLKFCKERNAVGLKFNTPYYRSLDFSDVTESDAAAIYLKGVKSGSLRRQEHKVLQDLIFRRLVVAAAAFDLVVQMHTGIGVGPGFAVAGSNPLLMEPVLLEAKNTKFLLLHLGWPFDNETVSLLAHENVYVDFSCENVFQSPRATSKTIVAALDTFPEKIMYGTDAYSDCSISKLCGVPIRANPLAGWEEKAWLLDRAGRQAVGLALQSLFDDGRITAGRATELVQMVMRDNAIKLYGLTR